MAGKDGWKDVVAAMQRKMIREQWDQVDTPEGDNRTRVRTRKNNKNPTTTGDEKNGENLTHLPQKDKEDF